MTREGTPIMLTNSKLTRLWNQSRYRALIREICDGRPEARLELDQRCGGPVAAAALGMLRLAELNQTHLPLASLLAERVLWSQNRDGSWGGPGDNVPLVTALAVRAIAAKPSRAVDVGRIAGVDLDRPAGEPKRLAASPEAWRAAVDRGLAHLASTQAEWQRDPFTTAFVLLQLGRQPGFLEMICVADVLAAEPTGGRKQEPDAATRWAWRNVHLRVGPALLAAKVEQQRPREAVSQPSLHSLFPLGNVA